MRAFIELLYGAAFVICTVVGIYKLLCHLLGTS